MLSRDLYQPSAERIALVDALRASLMRLLPSLGPSAADAGACFLVRRLIVDNRRTARTVRNERVAYEGAVS